MTLRLTGGAFALALFASTAAWSQAPSAPDAEFAMKAAIGNTFEMEEANLALQRATDQRLKDFAQKMVDEHGDAMKKLTDAAGKAGQKPEMVLDKPHQAMLDNLKTLNGKDFDKIYIADQVAAHAETVALLSYYNQNGQNSDLKSWAKEALPTVKGHRAAINAM
jgi:putative membrane protein